MFLPMLILFASCEKDDVAIPPDPLAGLHKITETVSEGTTITLYAQQPSLVTGYNRLFITLTDVSSGNNFENVAVDVKPMMDMGMMQHSSPVENAVYSSTRTAYATQVVFTMPTSPSGEWWLEISFIHPVSMVPVSTTLPVSVDQGTGLYIFQSLFDNARFYVALVEPQSPTVGINDLELAVFKQENSMSYPADSSLTINFEPEMPTMGHGSPNNVQPVHAAKGHYTGKVNFTMTGYWRLNLDFMDGTNVADSTGFINITF